MKTLFVPLLLLILLMDSVVAMTVYPPFLDLPYTPGEKVHGQYRVYHDKLVSVLVEGELAPYTRLLTEQVMSNCQSGCPVRFEVDMPVLETPGKQSVLLRIREGWPEQMMSGAYPTIGLYSNVFVPYPDQFLTIQLIASPESVRRDEVIHFTAEATNKGQKTVEKAEGNIIVFSSAKEYEMILPLTPFQTIEADASKTLQADWDTTGVPPGRYSARAVVNYDNSKTAEKTLWGLSVGAKTAAVTELSPLSFNAGEINKMTFALKNHWSEEVSLHVSFTLLNSDTTVITKGETPQVTILGTGEGSIDGFLDLSALQKGGTYSLEAVSHVVEGNEERSVFEITVASSSKEILPSLRTPTTGTTLWPLIIVMLIIAMSIAGYMFYRKQQDDAF